MPPDPASIRTRVKAWASELHAAKGQAWVDGRPYRDHLEAVETVLLRFGYAEHEFRLAAWCHDLLEDTDTSRDALREACGPAVEALVWAVTDEPGATRAERHEKTYPKIVATPGATILKLADRISNVEASIAMGPSSKLEKYRSEHPGFRAALYRPDERTDPMWQHLDDLLETK